MVSAGYKTEVAKDGADAQRQLATNGSVTLTLPPEAGFKARYAYVSQRGYYPDAPDKTNQDAVCAAERLGGNAGGRADRRAGGPAVLPKQCREHHAGHPNGPHSGPSPHCIPWCFPPPLHLCGNAACCSMAQQCLRVLPNPLGIPLQPPHQQPAFSDAHPSTVLPALRPAYPAPPACRQAHVCSV